MYATRAGTLSMMRRSSDSDARSASCACFSPWMSFISTNAPGTSPEGAESGTTRIVIQRDSPLAPGMRRSNSADSPSSARAIFCLRAFEDGGADHVAQTQRRDLVRGDAEVLQQRAVDVLAALVAIDVGDRRRHAVHDGAQLALARRQRVLGDLEVGDVVQHDVDALDRAVDPVVRHHPPADPARAARRIEQRALVAHGFAGERPFLVRRERCGVVGTDHLGRRLADHRRAVEAVELQERVVDEGVAPIRVEVDDRIRDVVGEETELLLARGERLLGALQVVNVVFGAVDAAELAVGVEVRRDAAMHPALLAADRRVDALVLDVLAAVRALEHRPQERRDARRQHFERRAAVDLLLRQAHPVRERLVDEGVRGGAIEIGDRAGNVVGEEPELHFLRAQRIANADVVVDVGHHGEDAVDAAADRAIGEERDAHPAQLARRTCARAARTRLSRR